MSVIDSERMVIRTCSPCRESERRGGGCLRPIGCERVHVHRVEPARETFVEGAQRVAKVAQTYDIGLQCFRLVD